MRRLLPLIAVLVTVPAAPAQAGFFRGDPIDGPSADIVAVGDVDMARDGTGALAYVKKVDGIPRAFVARFERGVFAPAEQVDSGLAGASSQPVVGVAAGGRIAVSFVNDGVVYGVVRPVGAAFSAPLPLATGIDPAVDMSINGVAYATFVSSGDVRVARLDARSNTWALLEQVADVDPAHIAGTGTGRPRVAVSADGVGVVTWGEEGHVLVRKMFGVRLSTSPQDLTLPEFEGRAAGPADLPNIDAEDDSSYAWVVYRQSFADGGSRVLARRQRGTEFDPPVAIDTGDEPVGEPKIDLNGRGVGLAATTGVPSGQPIGASLMLDKFNPAARMFAPSVAAPALMPAVAENNEGLVAAVLGAAEQPPAVVARAFDDGRPGADTLLSRPELGPVQPQLGFDAASDRTSGTVVAWVQGADGERRIVAGYADRAPGFFAGYTSQRCCRGPLPVLTWQEAFDLWGPLRYVVLVDGQPVGETGQRRFALTTPLRGGTHTWQVAAFDVRGQGKRSRTRRLRIDDLAPQLYIGYKRDKRIVTVSVRARDRGRGRNTVGVRGIVVSWGDRTRGARGTFSVRARHRYPRGAFPLEITATDHAGNQIVERRTVRIGPRARARR